MVCEGCKYADWRRTAAGRLHPDRTGRCTWEMPKIVVPAAFSVGSHCHYGAMPPVWGGYICRDKEAPHPKGCAAFIAIGGDGKSEHQPEHQDD